MRAAEHSTPADRARRAERLLLALATAFLPLENFTSVGGFSLLSLAFGAMGAYCLVFRPRELGDVIRHPVFLAAYCLVVTGFIVESFHSNSSYSELLRIVQMIAAAIAFATMCRDRSALTAVFVGFVIGGMYLSVLLLNFSYSGLSLASATDFFEASAVRSEVLAGFPLADNPNRMSYLAGTAAVLAAILGMHAQSAWHRRGYVLACLLCCVGALLPMSRGGVLIMTAGFGFVGLASRQNRGRFMAVAAVVIVTVLFATPAVVFSRLAYRELENDGNQEGRTRVYEASVAHFAEYSLSGVGEGNFGGAWGQQSDFAFDDRVVGAHNCFIQVMIYWGLPGLIALGAVVITAYRHLPYSADVDMHATATYAIALSVLLLMMFMHSLYSKDIAVALGIVAGTHNWSFWRQPRAARQSIGPSSVSARAVSTVTVPGRLMWDSGRRWSATSPVSVSRRSPKP